MPFIKLDIPAGVVSHGADSESAGRWRDVNFVRWENGSLRSIGGWVTKENRDVTDGTLDSIVQLKVTSTTAQAYSSGATEIEIASATLVEVGFAVSGAGIASNTTVIGITGNVIELSNVINVGGIDAGATLTFTNLKPRSVAAWRTNTGTAWVVVGTHNNLYSINEAGASVALLPTILSGTSDGAVENLGYGQYFYGKGLYGRARPSSGVVDTGDSWTLDTWGQDLLAVNTHEGTLYEWDRTGNATAITGDIALPTLNKSLVVTEERFLLALGADGNPRKVKWCDREDYSVWNPAATNEAGDFILDTVGKIILGLQVRGKTLIVTDVDAHTASYSGPPVVFGFEKVGFNCGAASQGCAVSLDSGAMWMGTNGFYNFNGQVVQEMPCDVFDYVFKDINLEQKHKITAVQNSLFDEVWWFYPNGSSTENNRYVVYDYKENHWNIGQLDRTAAFDAGVFSSPFWFDTKGVMYQHETGYNHDHTVDGVIVGAYAETGPIEAGSGDNVINVTKIIPEQANPTGTFQFALVTRNHPNDIETTHGPYLGSNETNVRLQARQLRLRIIPYVGVVDFSKVALEALRASVGLSTVADVGITKINGRYVYDLNDDGRVSSADVHAYNQFSAYDNGNGTYYNEYADTVTRDYITANVPATLSLFKASAESSGKDWVAGTIKLETKLGGGR